MCGKLDQAAQRLLLVLSIFEWRSFCITICTKHSTKCIKYGYVWTYSTFNWSGRSRPTVANTSLQLGDGSDEKFFRKSSITWYAESNDVKRQVQHSAFELCSSKLCPPQGKSQRIQNGSVMSFNEWRPTIKMRDGLWASTCDSMPRLSELNVSRSNLLGTAPNWYSLSFGKPTRKMPGIYFSFQYIEGWIWSEEHEKKSRFVAKILWM